MTRSELDLIRRALQLLHKIVPDDEIYEVHPVRRQCPVISFARRYLLRQPGADMATAELWKFYAEVAAAGESEPLTKQEFLRALPGAMAAVFGLRKCHSVQRDGQTLRGFKSVTIREQTSPVMTVEVETEAV
jgi:hypothetical protein